MQMNKRPEASKVRPEAVNSEGVTPRKVKNKQPKRSGKKISPGTIAKLVRDTYKNEPERILDLSPELFRLLSESERDRRKLDRQSYFENYVTERERHDLYSKLVSLTKEQTLSKEDCVRVLELAVPLGVEKEQFFESIIFKAIQTLGVDPKQGKDTVRQIRRGEPASRIEIYRGVILSYDWSGSLLEISLLGRDIAIRNAAQSLIGSLSWTPDSASAIDEANWALDQAKFVVIDESAISSMMNSQDQDHKRTSAEFMRLIDARCMILCAVESLISVLSGVSYHFGVSKAQEIANLARHLLRIVSSLPLGKNSVLELALSEACRGLSISSLHAILLCKSPAVCYRFKSD
ncbi:MAG: hypothetical protein JRJ29_18380 [Deltaproteobacteria bacterium]|nr:hypothetical protein [Deltaproteobacteria bacterium]